MAIQMRRGEYSKFDKSKMVQGEFGMTTSGDPNTQDGKSVYLCYATGDVRRMMDGEEIVNYFSENGSKYGVLESGSVMDIHDSGLYFISPEVTGLPEMITDGGLLLSIYYDSNNFVYALWNKGYMYTYQKTSGVTYNWAQR